MAQAGRALVFILLFFHQQALADRPAFFTAEMDNEYRQVIKHLTEVLPASDLPLAYLTLFMPMNLLDVRATHLSPQAQQEFSNFNLGVLGHHFLNINQQQLSRLPNIAICQNDDCLKERLDQINQFLAAADPFIEEITSLKTLKVVQQTAPEVFRINNTFITPTDIIAYTPSAEAGFVPSGNYTLWKSLAARPDIARLVTQTADIRELMGLFSVSAIVNTAAGNTDIIFSGISDNHWGVLMALKAKAPAAGQINAQGLEYEKIVDLGNGRYYYQTN